MLDSRVDTVSRAPGSQAGPSNTSSTKTGMPDKRHVRAEPDQERRRHQTEVPTVPQHGPQAGSHAFAVHQIGYVDESGQ